MRRLAALLVALVATFAAGACGSGDDGGSGGSGGNPALSESCDAGHCTLGDLPEECVQYDNLSGDLSSYEQICKGTWSTGGCPHHGIGGCRQHNGTACFVHWYSEALPLDNVKQVCAQSGGTFLEP